MASVVASPAVLVGEDVSSLTALAKSVKLADDIAQSLWEHLELDPLTDADVAAAIPTSVLDGSIDAFIENHQPSAGVADRSSLIFTKLRSAPESSPPVDPQREGPSSAFGGHKGKMSIVLDQGGDSSFEVLDPSKRAGIRANHVRMTGGPPPEGRTPSSE